MIYLLIICYIGLTFAGLLGFRKDKNKLEIAVFLVIMSISFIYNLAVTYNWRIPNLGDILSGMFDPIAGMVFTGKH